MEVSVEFQKTLIGEKFLIFDSRDENDVNDESRVVVFTTKRNLEHLSRDVWFLDGTFKVHN